jgi:hypothetical protein
VRLAGLRAGVAALEDALEEAVAAERIAHEAERRQASEVARIALCKKVEQREQDYLALDAAGAAYVEQVRRFEEGGRLLAAEASQLCRELHGARFPNYLGNTFDGASGKSAATAASIARVIEQVVEAFGSKHLGAFLTVNPYCGAATKTTALQAHERDLKLCTKGLLS